MKTSYFAPLSRKQFRDRAIAALFSLPVVFFPLLFILAPAASAVPAAPAPFEAVQADGSKVKVFLKGDEFYDWHEDEGGYTIVKDTGTNDWVYAEKDSRGSLKRTAHKVGKAAPAQLRLSRHLLDDKGVAVAKAMKRERDSSRRPSGAAVPSGPVPSSSVSISGDQPLAGPALPADGPQGVPIIQGTMNNLVILAKFSDQTTINTQAEFDALFNQIGYTVDGAVGSVKDYYLQTSYNKLTINSTVSQWVNLPQTAAYYGAGNPDANPRQMVIDAINALDAAGFDFSTMDANADGQVDGLTIIHSGFGAEFGGNSSDFIWSHQWSLLSPVVKDGKSMQMYHTEPERRGWTSSPPTQGITRIGVVAHETGHFLGLWDLYDYGGDSKGVGDFCIMAGGSWNGNYGTSPAHQSAYNKKKLTWVTPTTLSSAGTYSLPRVEDSDTAIYKFSGAGFAATEYFLIENKQNYGFDSALPGATRGALIWHVDETRDVYGGNDDQTHYMVDVEEAHSGTQHLAANVNEGDDGDYFRVGTLTGFSDSSTPDSKSYGAVNLVWEVQNISASGNPMSFYYGATDTTPPSDIASVNDGAGADVAYTASLTQLSANWTASADAESGVFRYWYAIGTTSGGTQTLGWTNNGTNLSVTRSGLSLTNGQIYYVSVKAENYQGLMSNVTTSNGQTADNTAPSNPGAVSDGTGTDAVWSNSLGQLSANWVAATDAQSGIARYDYAIGTTPGGSQTLGWTDNGAATSVTRAGLSLSDQQTYYFKVRAVNGSGLLSSAVNSNGQTVDATAPSSPGAVSDGLGADITYVNSGTQLAANWTAAYDGQSGIFRYLYAIGTTSGGTEILGWTGAGVSLSVTKSGLTLSDGQAYYFSVKAENGSGLESSAVNSNGQIADTTAPSDPGAVNDGTGADAVYAVSNTQLSANWGAAADAHSGIARYWYAIGTAAGGTSVTGGWLDNGAATSVTKTGLALTDGQIYYFTVKAENGVGLQSGAVNSNGQTVDGSAPSSPGPVNDGAGGDVTYVNSGTQLAANWSAAVDAHTGLAKYWYAIGTAAGGTDVTGWTDNGAATSVTKTGLTLTDGQAYYFTVKAENGAGLQTTPVNSNGQTADTTPPAAIASVNDGVGADISETGAINQLSANWTASSDAHSGIAKYWYAIGTTAGGTDTVGWTDNGAAAFVTRTGLSLTNQATYYFTVKAENGVGLQTAAVNSDGQLVNLDITPPADVAQVRDGAGADSAWAGYVTQLTANWDASSDPQSGIAKYYYGIGSAAGGTDVTGGWIDNGNVTSVTKTGLGLTNGQPYYFTVKAENGAGLQSGAVNSNGQTIDTSAPSAPGSPNDGAGADITYVNSATQLSANWTAGADAQSGIAKYWYAIGTTPGGTQTAAWTDNGNVTSVTRAGLTLTDGQIYYFTVKAENGGGLQSSAANSNGQTADTSAPSAPGALNDGVGADIAYANSASQLSANWTASSDAHSGIVKYWYAIGTTPGGTDVSGWTDNGNTLSVTKTGLSLTDGVTCYFTVKAENGAGLQSGAANSNGQIADITTPSVPGSLNDGLAADIAYANSASQLSANWTASSDAHSGIVKYWYAIGTTPGGTQLLTWTDNGNVLSVTKTGLGLAEGQIYYFTVKAENGAGLQSAAANSNGQIPDTSAPSAPGSLNDGTGDDAVYSNSLSQLSANWAAGTDLQSGIAKYWYAIGTTAGGTDVTGWTDNGAATSVTKTGLTLADGQIYYFTVKAENGITLQSPAVNSDGQRVDATAPSNPGAVSDGAGADVTYVNSATQLLANWTAGADAQSGVVKYWYAIGAAAGGTDISGWTDNGDVLSVTRAGLTLADGQIYYFTVKAENGAGLQSSAANSNGQTADTSAPSAPGSLSDGVGADITYVNSASQLSANWTAGADAHSGIAKYWYAIGTTAGGTDVSGWTDNSNVLSVTRAGLTLADGQVYYFTVKAENGAGLQSSAANSNGQMVDVSAPAGSGTVSDGTGADISETGALTQLSANWSPASDAQSGIVRYEYAIGTSAGATDFVDWTDNGTSRSVTRTGLVLVNGQTYYFTVRAYNGVGLMSAAVNSDGQWVNQDVTPPLSGPQVRDGLGADSPWAGSLTQLSANWDAGSDAESGILKYWYAIGTTAGGTEISGWTDNGNVLSVTRTGLALAIGQTYYFSVKAQNGADLLSSPVSSNGQTVDSTLPAAVTPVTDGLGADISYVPSLTTLSAVWNASYHSSGIAEYLYAIGTSSGAVDVLGWTSAGTATSVTKTGLSLSENTSYYFTVKARSNQGLESPAGASNGQKTDTAAPTAKVEITPAPPLKTGAFTATLTVTDLNPLYTSPSLSFIPLSGAARTLEVTRVSSAVWNASGFIDSQCSTGTAAFSFSAADAAGNIGTAVTEGGSFAVDTSVSNISGGTVRNSDGVSVIVPAAAYPDTLWLAISTPSASVISSADSKTYESVGLRRTVLAREFTAVTAAGARVDNFNKPVTIRLTWPDENDDGRVDGDYVKEDLLQLYYLDPVPGKWVLVPENRRNASLNTLEADVAHFSVYAIRSIASGAQDIGNIKVFPNPCYMEEGGLNFHGIPVEASGTKILIYNVAGELVRTLKRGVGIDYSTNRGTWDGRNSSGAKAASGLYIYLVKTDNHGKTTGKVTILW